MKIMQVWQQISPARVDKLCRTYRSIRGSDGEVDYLRFKIPHDSDRSNCLIINRPFGAS